MKKFKKSIEISTKNISDVLQVPIVTSLYKTKNFLVLVVFSSYAFLVWGVFDVFWGLRCVLVGFWVS